MKMYAFPMPRQYGEPPSAPGVAPHRARAPRGADAAVAAGAALLLAALLGAPLGRHWAGPLVTFGLLVGGAIARIRATCAGAPATVVNDGVFFSSTQARGRIGWALGVLLTGFYTLLYWFPSVIEGAVRLVDPVAHAIAGHDADRWFLYGFLYTLAMIVFGTRMFLRYRHNRYQQVRTASVVFFQLGFAFLIPHVLERLSRPEFYFTYFWPLKPDYLFPDTVHWLTSSAGHFGAFLVAWGIVMSFVATPVLTFFFGKRWYCSWVCGCGGLAETMGDPWRHLSDKSPRAWKVERWMIHTVLVLIVVTTAMLWIDNSTRGAVFGSLSHTMRRWYGFAIGMVFSGVVGVGFYPLLGSRVWCRFGCPQAAILGLIQRYVSRFRITVNGGQCMSCGNCSTYCEMGIDVRAYAQRGENVVRASCVGCGVCAAVCPRGVLRLENGPVRDRFPGADRPARAFLESLGLRRRTTGRGAYWT